MALDGYILENQRSHNPCHLHIHAYLSGLLGNTHIPFLYLSLAYHTTIFKQLFNLSNLYLIATLWQALLCTFLRLSDSQKSHFLHQNFYISLFFTQFLPASEIEITFLFKVVFSTHSLNCIIFNLFQAPKFPLAVIRLSFVLPQQHLQQVLRQFQRIPSASSKIMIPQL